MAAIIACPSCGFPLDGNPVNVLNQISQVPKVCGILCATATLADRGGRQRVRSLRRRRDRRHSARVEPDTDIATRKNLSRAAAYEL